jgi:hypothetical protein
VLLPTSSLYENQYEYKKEYAPTDCITSTNNAKLDSLDIIK